MAQVHRDWHHARMRRQYTSEQRSKLVELVTGGQATVPEAAARLGVAPATAYYWLKKQVVGRRGAQGRRGGRRGADQGAATTFVRLVPSVAADAAIAIRVGGTEIQVRRGFDGDLLRAVVTALLEGAQ
jgi:transposase-like protein